MQPNFNERLSRQVEKISKRSCGSPYGSVTTRRYDFLMLYTALYAHNDRTHLIPILEHPIASGCMRVGHVPPSRAIEAPRDRLSATAKLFPNAYDCMRSPPALRPSFSCLTHRE